MKFTRGEDGRKVGFDMTPMIDVCFQLIIFFMVSLRIFSPEGDFGIRMPIAAPSPGQVDNPLPPIRLRLLSNAEGQLAGIQMGERRLGSFQELHQQIRAIVGDDRGPGSVAESTEVELDCDYQLKFEYVMDAITAVSGYVVDGRIVKLIEKVKFSPPRKG